MISQSIRDLIILMPYWYSIIYEIIHFSYSCIIPTCNNPFRFNRKGTIENGIYLDAISNRILVTEKPLVEDGHSCNSIFILPIEFINKAQLIIK